MRNNTLLFNNDFFKGSGFALEPKEQRAENQVCLSYPESRLRKTIGQI